MAPKLPPADVKAITKRAGVTFHIDNPSSLIECRTETLLSPYHSENIATLTLTSGSTGLPKAVAHTVSNHLHSAAGILQVMPLGHDDCWLLSLPLFHVSGLAIIWRWLLSGARMKVTPVAGEQLFSAFDNVTHASLVPTQLQRLLSHGKPDALKEVLLGGAEIPVSLTSMAEQSGIRCWCGYGMTEMASTITVKRADGELTVGTPLAYRQVAISGESEVLVGGGPLSPGYMVDGELKPLPLTDGLFSSGIGVNGRVREQTTFACWAVSITCLSVVVRTSNPKPLSVCWPNTRALARYLSCRWKIVNTVIERLLLSNRWGASR